MSATLERAVAQYLRQLVVGDRENAFFGLTDLGPEASPWLEQAYRAESSVENRVKILKVIAELRSPSSLELLGQAVREVQHSDLWRAALNGYVRLASPAAAAALAVVIHEKTQSTSKPAEYLEWLREAHQQTLEAVQENLARGH